MAEPDGIPRGDPWWVPISLGVFIAAGLADTVVHPLPAVVFSGCDVYEAVRYQEPCWSWPVEIRRHDEAFYIMERWGWRRIDREDAATQVALVTHVDFAWGSPIGESAPRRGQAQTCGGSAIASFV